MYVTIYEEDCSKIQELDGCVMSEGKDEDGEEKGVGEGLYSKAEQETAKQGRDDGRIEKRVR